MQMTDEPDLCRIPELSYYLFFFFFHQIYAFYKADFFLFKKILKNSLEVI